MKTNRIIVAAGMAFASTVSAITAPFINNVGGTYEMVTDYQAIDKNDIYIFASYAKTSGELANKIRLLTNTSTSNVKYCSSVVYSDYDVDALGMPKYVSVAHVNENLYPYEYVSYNLKVQSASRQIMLQNIDGKYWNMTGENEFILEDTPKNQKAWSFANDHNHKDVVLLANQRCENYLRCVGLEESVDNQDLFCVKGNPNVGNPVYTYKKVFTVAIGSTGFSTFYNSNNDVQLPSGVKAYIYTLDGDRLIPSHTYDGDKGDMLPYNTAVILYGQAGEYTFVIKNSQTKCLYESVLRGSDDREITTSGNVGEVCKYYALGKGSNGIGFYYVNDSGAPFTNKAHKAYLCIETTKASSGVRFVLPDDVPTSIDSRVYNSIAVGDGRASCHDLEGRKVDNSKKSVIITGGRKYVRK